MTRPVLHVYSRRGCHLCEVLIEKLLPLTRGRFSVEVRDIDSQASWQEAYNVRVPVVEYDGECLCQYELDAAAIEGLAQKLGLN